MKYTKYLVNRIIETQNKDDIRKLVSLEKSLPEDFKLIFDKMKSIYREAVTDSNNLFVETQALLDKDDTFLLAELCDLIWLDIIESETLKSVLDILLLVNIKINFPLDWKALQELSSDRLPAIVLDELQRRYNLSIKRLNKEWKDRIDELNRLKPVSSVKCCGSDYAVIYHTQMIVDYLLECKHGKIVIYKTLTLMDKLISAILLRESYISVNSNLIEEFIKCPIRFGKTVRLVSSKYVEHGLKIFSSMNNPYKLFIEGIFGFDKRTIEIDYSNKTIKGIRLITDYLITLDVLSSCGHKIDGIINTGISTGGLNVELNQELLNRGNSKYFEIDVMFADNRYEELMEHGFKIVKSRQKPGKHAQKLLDEIGLNLAEGETIKLI